MLHYRAWELGIKSLYYLRSKSVQRAGFAGGVEADNTPELKEIELQSHRLRRMPGLPVNAVSTLSPIAWRGPWDDGARSGRGRRRSGGGGRHSAGCRGRA